MLKRFLNELTVDLTISPDGPVLIKSGVIGMGTDMSFVTTMRHGKKEVYLPGTSLKGVLRSHCEKICRTLQPKSVCEPFDVKEHTDYDPEGDFIACSQVFNKNAYWKEGAGKSSCQHYAASCPACRMFGSLKFKGRCFMDDAYAVGEAPQPHIRDGVAIERFTGAAKGGAKYDFEVITSGTFATQVHLVNFEMWQLELLIFALRDLVQGYIRIGMATSRGLGKIKAQLTKVTYACMGRLPDQMVLADISTLEQDEDEKRAYRFDTPKVATVSLAGLADNWQSQGIRHSVTIPPEKFLGEIATQLQGVLAAYLDKNPARAMLKEHYYCP